MPDMTPDKTANVIGFLEHQVGIFAYENTAMSQHRFSLFLEELLDVMRDSVETEDSDA